MAFNFNPNNHGHAIGRLARDPKRFDNKDGSKSVRFTLMVDRAYEKDGETPSDAVEMEAFVPSKTEYEKTPFAHLHTGDLVLVDYTVRVGKAYADKSTGEVIYPGPTLAVEYVKNLEPKKVTQERLANRVNQTQSQNQATQQAAAPVAAAPAQQAQDSAVADQESLPFG